MLRKHSLLGRVLSLLILGAYIGVLYYALITFLPQNGLSLSGFEDALSFRSGQASRSNGTPASYQKLLVTTDGGATWTAGKFENNILGNYLTCPGPETCYATGYNMDPTKQPGRNGNSTVNASGPVVLNTSGNTFVIASSGDSGRTWSRQAIPLQLPSSQSASDPDLDENDEDYYDPELGLGPLSCPSPTRCFALAFDSRGVILLITENAGASWAERTSPVIPTATPKIAHLSCPSAETCFVTGTTASANLILKTSDAGNSWQQQWSDPESGLGSLTCSSPLHCMASDRAGRILLTADGGNTWQKNTTIPAKNLSEINCPDSRVCFALGKNSSSAPTKILTSRDGGTSWTTAKEFSAKDGLYKLSCPSPDACMVAGSRNAIHTTDDGGLTWLDLKLPDSNGGLMALSCPSPSNCYALTLSM